MLLLLFTNMSTKPCFSHKKRSTPLSFINVDISQRLQAISLPFTDCALNEATMNGCTFVSSFLHLDLNGDCMDDDIRCLNP